MSLSSAVRARYARCEEYEDRGTVTKYNQSWGYFETRYLRAIDALHLFFVSENKSVYAVDVKGNDVTVTFPPALAGPFKRAFLGPAPHRADQTLAKLITITGAVSIIVPSLLVPAHIVAPEAFGRGFIVDPTTGLLNRFVDPDSGVVITYQPTLRDPGFARPL